jgi:predicted RNA-binding Zn-ribbon protein involved in translation (DUF1610 family)
MKCVQCGAKMISRKQRVMDSNKFQIAWECPICHNIHFEAPFDDE